MLEVVDCESLSELSVERSTVGNKGACLGNVSSEPLLGARELLLLLFPSDLVVFEGIDESVGLVHLLSGSAGVILELLLLGNLLFVLFSQLGFVGIDLIELFLSNLELSSSLLESGSLEVEHLHLGLHNL